VSGEGDPVGIQSALSPAWTEAECFRSVGPQHRGLGQPFDHMVKSERDAVMATPRFPEFKLLEIDDRDEMERLLGAVAPVSSELTFTNLFMWRHSYRFQISMHGACLLVFACPGDEHFFLPPLCRSAKLEVFAEMMDFMEQRGWAPRVARVPTAMAEEAGLTRDPRFRVETKREHADYVYLTERLIRLSGKRLHSKKNHLNAFLKGSKFQFEPISPDNVEDCLSMQESWCNLRDCTQIEGLRNEELAVYEVLKNWDRLSCSGGVIRMDGRVEAFSLGERLNPETAVIHIEKANPEIRGLYAAINQQCCEQLWSDFRYVNREQDLGEVGLRRAKLSYDPVFLVEKCTVLRAKRSRLPEGEEGA